MDRKAGTPYPAEFRAQAVRLVPAEGASVPAAARGLAVTADRICTLDPEGGRLWAIDRRRGHVVQSIQVGGWPVSLRLGPSRSR